MADTLEALNRAVIAAPEDRTVRLVYADALDEAGDAARAEFVRAQVQLETLPESDFRHVTLPDRVRDLFDAHWLDWWQPVCAPAGLPEPHVPGRRRRAPRPPGARRRRRARNWPYTHTAADATVHAAGYGLAVRFACGFPEELRFLHLETPEDAAAIVHRWGDAMPLVRLAFTHAITPREWKRVAGPHLARLPELEFDHLTAEAAAAVAASPHLANLRRLSAHAVGTDTDTIRALVATPTWTGLRALRFTGPLPPAAVREVADRCRLPKLEELELAFGNAADPLGGVGMLGSMIGQMLRAIMQAVALPAWGEPRWAEFGPSVEALAAARWVRRLRRLTLGPGLRRGLAAFLGERLQMAAERETPDVIPDGPVVALADALNRKTFEKLTLPASVLSPAARAAVADRLGPRVEFE